MKEVSVTKIKYKQLLDDVRNLRSTVVEYAITIENIISEILIDFLGNDSTKSIFEKHLFSDVLAFDKKIMLFNALYKDLLPKTETKINIPETLGYVKMLRNYMAHCSIHAPDVFIDNYTGEWIEFGSFTQKDEHVVVKVYKSKIDEDMKKRIYSSELFYEKCKIVIEELLSLHDRIISE